MDAIGDWMVVTPRRRKQKRILSNTEKPPTEKQPWTPTENDTDPKRESRLMKKMQECIRNLENSEFYHRILAQIQTPEIVNNHISRILNLENKMQMVIYGIGSIKSYETPRLQLSLAILIKRKFEWIGEIEVFDPVLSMTETRVLESLGCSVLLVNEQGRRQVLNPTMFFMPHCEAVLYDNLLQENWQAELLNRIVLFGNSFEAYEQHISDFKNTAIFDSAKFIVRARKFSAEIKVEVVSDAFFRAFHDSSWHFFDMDSQLELELQSWKL